MATFASASTAATLAVAAPSVHRRCSTAVSFHAAGRRRRLSSVARYNAGPKQLRISANLAGLWEAARGASPAAVLASLAAAAVIYKATSGLLAPARPPPPRRQEDPETAAPPAPAPVEVGEVSEEELRQYDGSDPEKPLLMSINGQIYDVSQSRMFYGPGGPYALFAGKDASRALAKMSFEPQDLTSDISGLGPFELSALQDWECKFMNKYVKVGTIKKTVHVEAGIGGTSPETQEQVAADMELKEDNAPRTDLSFKEKNQTESVADEGAKES